MFSVLCHIFVEKKDPDFVKTVSYIRMNINNQNPVKSAEKDGRTESTFSSDSKLNVYHYFSK